MPAKDNNTNEKNENKPKRNINSGRQRKRHRRRRRRRHADGDERDSESDEEDDNKLTGKCWGLIVQVIIYITNCILWVCLKFKFKNIHWNIGKEILEVHFFYSS